MDLLTAPAGISLTQRSQDRGHKKMWAGEVGIGNTDPSRPLTVETSQHVEAGSGHQDVAHAWTDRPWPMAVRPRQVQRHDVGLQRSEHIVAETHAFHRSGTKVVHDHVGGGDQFLNQFHPLFGAEVNRERFLTRIHHIEQPAHVWVWKTVGTDLAAHRVGSFRGLHPDDFGSEAGE